MEQLTGILGILLIFGAIIAIHEFGHFIAAKLSGMTVYEYSLGFGPALFKRTFRDTLYAVRIIPLGGYVRIAGMEPGEEDSPNGYDKKPFFAKFATIAAGATMNFVLAFIVISLVGLFIGVQQPGKDITVLGVFPKSPAATAGIKAGDRIISINEVAGSQLTLEKATQTIRGSKGAVRIVVERQHKDIALNVQPRMVDGIEREGMLFKIKKFRGIGVQFGTLSSSWRTLGFVESIKVGAVSLYRTIDLALAQFLSIVTGNIPLNMISGPPGIMKASYDLSSTTDMSRLWISNVLNNLALFSVLIGFFNLLPFPALDGGRLLFLTIEGVRGKPMNKEKEAMVHAIGMAVLLALILIVSVKDIFGMFGGK